MNTYTTTINKTPAKTTTKTQTYHPPHPNPAYKPERQGQRRLHEPAGLIHPQFHGRPGLRHQLLDRGQDHLHPGPDRHNRPLNPPLNGRRCHPDDKQVHRAPDHPMQWGCQSCVLGGGLCWAGYFQCEGGCPALCLGLCGG